MPAHVLHSVLPACTTAHVFAAIITAFRLMPAGSHFRPSPNKIALPADEYMTAQKKYVGWALAGIAFILAPLAALWHAWLVQKQRSAWLLSPAAALGMAAGGILARGQCRADVFLIPGYRAFRCRPLRAAAVVTENCVRPVRRPGQDTRSARRSRTSWTALCSPPRRASRSAPHRGGCPGRARRS